MNRDERVRAAWHEAGHAVAHLMRGGGELHRIDIDEQTHGNGYTAGRAKPCDLGFITYAGPWAEARYLWLVGPDEDDLDEKPNLSDIVVCCLLEQPADSVALRTFWAEQRQQIPREPSPIRA